MTAADRLAKIRTHATDPSYGPVPGAEVVWLCDEVGRLRAEAERRAQSIGDWSWRALSAEADAAGWKARAKAAERALTDLRAGIERIRDALTAHIAEHGPMIDAEAPEVDLTRLLDGSGEQPGEDEESEDVHAAPCDADEALRERVMDAFTEHLDPSTWTRARTWARVRFDEPPLGTCYSDECREPCQSQQRQARAELHEARAELAKVSTRLGEARRALADLRGQIEARADTKPGATGRALRALLAGSGEQPGEVVCLKGDPTGLDGWCVHIGYRHRSGTPDPRSQHRPAPVVPDSPDVRDITDQVRYAWCWYGGATREESDQRAAQFDTWLASLAVVGQGVRAECDHARAARDLMRTYPGTLSDATALVDAFAQADRAVVRSGEKEG